MAGTIGEIPVRTQFLFIFYFQKVIKLAWNVVSRWFLIVAITDYIKISNLGMMLIAYIWKKITWCQIWRIVWMEAAFHSIIRSVLVWRLRTNKLVQYHNESALFSVSNRAIFHQFSGLINQHSTDPQLHQMTCPADGTVLPCSDLRSYMPFRFYSILSESGSHPL